MATEATIRTTRPRLKDLPYRYKRLFFILYVVVFFLTCCVVSDPGRTYNDYGEPIFLKHEQAQEGLYRNPGCSVSGKSTVLTVGCPGLPEEVRLELQSLLRHDRYALGESDPIEQANQAVQNWAIQGELVSGRRGSGSDWMLVAAGVLMAWACVGVSGLALAVAVPIHLFSRSREDRAKAGSLIKTTLVFVATAGLTVATGWALSVAQESPGGEVVDQDPACFPSSCGPRACSKLAHVLPLMAEDAAPLIEDVEACAGLGAADTRR